MKPVLRILFFAALWAGFFSLPVAQTGCSHTVTLEKGGAYTDPVLATTDQSILDASKTMTAFLGWHQANSAYLSRWPEVAQLAATVAVNKDSWIRDAYAARDAYAVASKAYRTGLGTSPDPQRAKLNAALSLLNNITAQVVSYRTNHPHA